MSSSRWFLLSFLGGWDCLLDSKHTHPCFEAQRPRIRILFYVAVLRLRKGDRSGPSTAIFAMLGAWVLALLFILLAQGVRRGDGPGFGWEIVLLVMLAGSIISLWLETVATVICHVAFERTRWIVPPSL
jgi:hypothetical protein